MGRYYTPREYLNSVIGESNNGNGRTHTIPDNARWVQFTQETQRALIEPSKPLFGQRPMPIRYVGELVQLTEHDLKKRYKLSERSIGEVIGFLEMMGLWLGMTQLQDWDAPTTP